MYSVEFTYQEPRFPFWLPERQKLVSSYNQAWKLKTEPMEFTIWFDIQNFPHKIALKEVWIGTGYDDICFDKNLILIDNQGQEAYRIGARIEEIFQVYNMGCPISRYWLNGSIQYAIENELERIAA